MAKPISFTKRDLEKKKQEKRLAKQQKKEERKNSGTSSFEDMILQYFQRIWLHQKPEKCREVLFPCKRSARRGNRRKFSDFQTGTRTTRNECRRNQTQEITPTAVYVFTTFLYFSSKKIVSLQ